MNCTTPKGNSITFKKKKFIIELNKKSIDEFNYSTTKEDRELFSDGHSRRSIMAGNTFHDN